MHRGVLAVLAGVLCVLLATQTSAATGRANCKGILPVEATSRTPQRDVSADDLASLRDLSSAAELPLETPFGVSPDGRSLAFVLYQGEPTDNQVCRALVVIPIARGGKPRVLDSGGDLILAPSIFRNLVQPSGPWATNTPHWSPDGRTIAYLKRIDGVTQVWLVPVKGGHSWPATRSPVDVEAVAWLAGGRELIFRSRPGRLSERQKLEQERLSGYRYDDRFVPGRSNEPLPTGNVPAEYSAIDVLSDGVRSALPSEIARLNAGIDHDFNPSARAISLRPEQPAEWPTTSRIWLIGGGQEPLRCSANACAGQYYRELVSFWWHAASQEVLILRREGPARSSTALYRWSSRTGRSIRILSSEDLIAGCRPLDEALVCVRETSTTPQHIIKIDIATGRIETLFDPNPEFRRLRKGKVTRLYWRNDLGLETFGDLVLPPGYKEGQKLPLIVVQYRSRGFLRGGVGDEYPIFPFAAHGHAVLSVERTPFYDEAGGKKWRSFEDAVRAGNANWSDRWSSLSSVRNGVKLAIATGLIDPTRVGITGLSDGATTARFALINDPDLFAAASVSTCCADGDPLMIYGGPAIARERLEMGFPSVFADGATEAWAPISLRISAAKVRAPVLMQLADREFIGGLEAYTSLKEHDKPVDMYVFDDEYHMKWQPAHRLAIYNRNLDWFDFWFLGRRDLSSAKAEQYRIWDLLRERQRSP